MVAFVLQGQSWVVAAETLKLCSGPLAKKEKTHPVAPSLHTCCCCPPRTTFLLLVGASGLSPCTSPPIPVVWYSWPACLSQAWQINVFWFGHKYSGVGSWDSDLRILPEIMTRRVTFCWGFWAARIQVQSCQEPAWKWPACIWRQREMEKERVLMIRSYLWLQLCLKLLLDSSANKPIHSLVSLSQIKLGFYLLQQENNPLKQT